MISFRFHLVSLVAVLLALATGIALGSGPLQGSVSQRLAASQDGSPDTATSPALLRDAVAVAGFQDGFAATAAARLVPGRLTGRAVLVVTLPEVAPRTVEAVRTQVDEAGGSVSGVLAVQPKLLDPDQRQLAEGVARQVLATVAGVPPTDDMSSYELVGTALGRAYLTRRAAGDPRDDSARTIGTSLAQAGFVTEREPVSRRAGLAIVLTGPMTSTPVVGQDQLVEQLVTAMDAVSAGVVVAGPVSAGAPGGLVAAVADSGGSGVSTVDTVDTAAGRVVTVLALAEQATGEAGQYGTDRAADGAVPTLPATR